MDIKIISTDFDGTLVSDSSRPSFVPEFIERIDALKANGAHWAVNTGRSLFHIVQGLRQYDFPFSPDYVLTNEREVFCKSEDHADHDGWEDFGEWNERCTTEHDRVFELAEKFFEQVESYAVEQGRLRILQSGKAIEGLVADSAEAMEEFVDFVEEARSPYPLISYQRNSVYLRFCHIAYHKGSALAELSRLLGIGRDQIFAVGDNHNDLPMLDGSSAAMVACPGNSVPEVKDAVREAGGYVARHHVSAGVVEAIDHFLAL